MKTHIYENQYSFVKPMSEPLVYTLAVTVDTIDRSLSLKLYFVISRLRQIPFKYRTFSIKTHTLLHLPNIAQ
jgi:hypothetical protein